MCSLPLCLLWVLLPRGCNLKIRISSDSKFDSNFWNKDLTKACWQILGHVTQISGFSMVVSGIRSFCFESHVLFFSNLVLFLVGVVNMPENSEGMKLMKAYMKAISCDKYTPEA